MAFDEGTAYDLARSWETKYRTLKDQTERIQQDGRDILTMFAARKTDGSFSINFEKFANNLGLAQCLELRKVIDEMWRISGDPGEKPRVKMKLATQETDAA